MVNVDPTDRDFRFQTLDASRINARSAGHSAHEIVEWASNMFGDGLVMSTSFGIQSAVMLRFSGTIR